MLAKYKRKVAPLVLIGIAVLVLAGTLSNEAMANGTSPRYAVGMVGVLIMGIGLYYWAMAKGHASGGWFLLGFVPVLGLLAVALLPDKHKDAPPEGTDEAEPLRNCPHCGAPYRESDYSPDAPQILCGKCHGVLPR